MMDKIEKVNNTLIQHGEQNDRVYVMKIREKKEDVKYVIKDIEKLADDNKYTKIIAKVPEKLKQVFDENSYKVEAEVPRFYNDREKCFFMAKYFGEERQIEKNDKLIKEVIKKSKSKNLCKNLKLDDRYTIKKCGKEDVFDICALYSEVFETYPFPIFDPNYIKSTMNDNVIYFGVWEGERLVAISSIELYKDSLNAEMTDFSTHPDYRGQNLSLHLLDKMEDELKALKVPTAYSIARSVSFGMNSTFSKLGYSYAGTLKNNTNIGGQIESMNVWFKSIET